MKKIIIIGAGPAGLTAAYELLKQSKDYDVVILEETNDIGGISKTINYKGNRMDIGGHRFFTKDERVMKFWKSILKPQGKISFDDKLLGREAVLEKGGPDPELEEKVMLTRQRVSRIYCLKKFFDYPISMKMQTFKNMGLKRTIKAGLSYMKSMVIKRKENSLDDFFINRFGKVLYQMFFEKYTEKLWGRHPSKISADWGAQRVKGLSILEIIKDMIRKVFKIKSKKVETSLIESFYYPKLGPGQLWETVAEEIINMGGKILKGYGVESINKIDGKIEYVICNVDGKKIKIEGHIFISSMPVKNLVESITGDKVDKDTLEIAKGLSYRDFVTVGILLKKMNLKNETAIKTLNNIVPDNWIYVQEPDVKLGRIQVFNNWSPYLVKDPENTIWIGLEYFCFENDSFWNMTDKEASEFAVNELINMKIIQKEDVIDTHREKVKKAYPAYFDTYERFGELKEYLNTIENLYCIGRNGQHRYNNMDHSMATAFETVKNILSGEKSKDNIWAVNTESEYQEEKKEENKK